MRSVVRVHLGPPVYFTRAYGTFGSDMKHSQAMFIRSRKLIILLETVMLFNDNVQLIDRSRSGVAAKVVLAVDCKDCLEASIARRKQVE